MVDRRDRSGVGQAQLAFTIATLPAQEGFLKSAQELVAPVADHIPRTAVEAEATRRLPGDLVRLLKDAGLFSIYTPKEFGGRPALPEALRIVEEVSRHDGSTEWTVALGVANSLFTSVLPEASTARVLADGAALIAAAPAIRVHAMRVDGGYGLTGRWLTKQRRAERELDRGTGPHLRW